MIKLIPYPSSTPQSVEDYNRQNTLLQTALLRADIVRQVDGNKIVQGAIFQIAGPVFISDTGTEITGTKSDYVRISVSAAGDTAVAEFVPDLTGVSWNSVYRGYYDDAGNLYLFDESKAKADGKIAEYKKSDTTFLRTYGTQKIYGRKIFEDTNLIKWRETRKLQGLESNNDTGQTPAVAALNGNDFVLVDTELNRLRLYEYVPNRGVQPASNNSYVRIPNRYDPRPALTALSGDVVIFADTASDRLDAYRVNRDGIDQIVTQEGMLDTLGYFAMTALNSTDFVVAQGGTGGSNLRAFRFDGETFTQIGQTLVMFDLKFVSVTALNSTDFVLVTSENNSTQNYMVFRFDGETFTEIGARTAVIGPNFEFGQGRVAATALNGTDFLLCKTDPIAGHVNMYRFVDGVISFLDVRLEIRPPSTHYGLTSLSDNEFIIADTLKPHLTAYAIEFQPRLFPGPHNPAGSSF